MTTTLRLNAAWRINADHILYLKEDLKLDGKWQIGLQSTLIPSSRLYVSEQVVAEFRENMPASFLELRPVGQSWRVLMNMEKVTGVERTELPAVPAAAFGSLPAASAMFERSISEPREMMPREGSKYAFYALIGDKRLNIMTLVLDRDPFELYDEQLSKKELAYSR